jgi:hypothetical protein
MPKPSNHIHLTNGIIILTRCSSFFCTDQSFGQKKPHFMGFGVRCYQSIDYNVPAYIHNHFPCKNTRFLLVKDRLLHGESIHIAR